MVVLNRSPTSGGLEQKPQEVVTTTAPYGGVDSVDRPPVGKRHRPSLKTRDEVPLYLQMTFFIKASTQP